MSIRQDQAQLLITIDAKESVEYQKSVQRSNELVRNIKKMEVGTEEYIEALREQAEISKKLGDSDYTKLSIKNLKDRRDSLQKQIQMLPQAQAAELGLERELQRVNTALAQNAQRTRAVNGAIQENSRSTINWRNIYAVSVGILTGAAVAIGTITAKFQKYSAVLKVALGSQQESDKAMQLVKESAAQTTFTVDELTESYVKFANRGIKLTKDEIISLSDLAASQGKSFDQLTEAILDAQTGEFERLKEFGIRASKSGDEANISFKGFNATAKLTPDAIKNTFVEMGKLNGVAGANAEQMTTLGGRWSNFGDVTDSILVSLGNSGIGRVFGNLIGQATEYGKKLIELINPSKTAADETRKLQGEFNNEIGVLKRLSPEAQGRRDIIQAINEKYKDYLPNLLSETASIKEIEAAQRAANKVFEEKLIFLAFEEEYQKQIDKTKEAIKRLAGAEISRARSAQANENLGQIGATAGQLEAQRKINESFIGSVQKNAEEQINQNDKVVAELEGAYDVAAKRIGSTLDTIRKKFTNTSDTEGTPVTASGPSAEAIKKAAEEREKAKAKAEKEAKKRFSEIDKTINVDTTSQILIDQRLKELEDAAAKEQLLLEQSYQQGNLTKEQYEIDSLRITSANLAARIQVLDAFGQQESDKRIELNVEMLKIDKDIVEKRAKIITDQEIEELTALEQMFLQRLLTEEEYNAKALKIKINHGEQVLAQLKAEGKEQTVAFKEQQEKLLALKLQYNGLTGANDIKSQVNKAETYQQALAALDKAQDAFNAGTLSKEELHQAKLKAIRLGAVENLKDALALGIDLLSVDEKARKKHANAIKAFESAQIAINLASEIQGIWKNANANPINSLLPGWGPVFAGLQTGFAVARAGIQTARVNAQKFEFGGQLKDGAVFDGPSHSFGGVKFRVGGEINEAEGGEIIINKRSSKVFAKELDYINSYKGYGRKLFNRGGIVPSLPSTTPTSLNARILSNNQVQQPIIQTDPRIEMLVDSMDKLVGALPAALSNIKADVSYFDFKTKENTLNEIKSLSSY